MSINSIENATRYSNELDKMFAQKSATGFLPTMHLQPSLLALKP